MVHHDKILQGRSYAQKNQSEAWADQEGRCQLSLSHHTSTKIYIWRRSGVTQHDQCRGHAVWEDPTAQRWPGGATQDQWYHLWIQDHSFNHARRITEDKCQNKMVARTFSDPPMIRRKIEIEDSSSHRRRSYMGSSIIHDILKQLYNMQQHESKVKSVPQHSIQNFIEELQPWCKEMQRCAHWTSTIHEQQSKMTSSSTQQFLHIVGKEGCMASHLV